MHVVVLNRPLKYLSHVPFVFCFAVSGMVFLCRWMTCGVLSLFAVSSEEKGLDGYMFFDIGCCSWFTGRCVRDVLQMVVCSERREKW